MNVAVIGGAGHVGLGMCLVLVDVGHFVYGVDIDQSKNKVIMSGKMPFLEEQGEEYLSRALSKHQLVMTDDCSVVTDCDVIVIVIGTPVDENFNPEIHPLRSLISAMAPSLRAGQLLILRSTVSPGTTESIKRIIEENTELSIGRDLFLVFAPERVAEGKTIQELTILPQLIGAFEDASFQKGKAFFGSFLKAPCIELSPLEAEIGKLITNMTRYVNFALANEYHLIAETFGVNINKIIDASNFDYPRLNLPSPGPNVGGPCLYKDGWFLIERIPYNEMIATAFKINEGMPMQIVQKLRQFPEVRKVSVLGMTFKANSDDIRNSVSFKLKKQLDATGYEVITVDSYVPGCDPLASVADSDAVILMTPHDEFKGLEGIVKTVGNPNCLYVDIWGFWPQMRHQSANGYFLGSEVTL